MPSHVAVTQRELMISNYSVDSAEEIALLTMRPYEARVYRIN